jgi:geranylgeranyl transferase type-2 subunit beta
MPNYLETLTARLAYAVADLPERIRHTHGRFVLASQRSDGGFAGREGQSDLYYTGFGLRLLAVLGLLDGEPAERARGFLRRKLTGQESVVDFLSLMYGAKLLESSAGIEVFQDARAGWSDSVFATLMSLRREDGGFSKGPGGNASSTYHTFLVTLCLQLIEREMPNPALVVRFVMSRADDDGGFREIRVSKRAGTNPTAAAIGTLRILDSVTTEVREGTIDFIAGMQNDEGGLRANTRIPIADVLSTFTGLTTLTDLEAADAIDLRAAEKYVRSLESESGGFLGAAWDSRVDVEYSFYGLASLALLHSLLCNRSRPVA